MTTNLELRDEPDRYDILLRRIDQLEKALMAVALNRPTACDQNGRLVALDQKGSPRPDLG